MNNNEQGIQAKVYKKLVLATHGIMITKTAMFISERVLLVDNLLRIVFYLRTTLGVKPSFNKSLATVSASFSVQKAPTKSLISFLASLLGRP
jgi:hypothetical protein